MTADDVTLTEAERDNARRRLAEVEALHQRWETDLGEGWCPSCHQMPETDCDHGEGYHHALSDIRAALANPPAVQRDAEVGARALREAADEIGEGDGISRFIGMDSTPEAVRAEKRAQEWLRARADALTTDTAGGKSERDRERADWSSWLDGWLSAVGPKPPTVEDVARALREGPRPFGVAALPAEGDQP